MALVIVTGMSGAGKSIAMNALEDMGYYCVDNLPAKFLVGFADLYGMTEKKEEKKIATVADIRSKDMFQDFFLAMEQLSSRQYPYKILFLDADDQTLMNRYKFTRRRHPLMESGEQLSMQEALTQERQFLSETRQRADYIIDTSVLKSAQLRERVISLFSTEGWRESLVVRVMSFGFRNGLPADADLVFDVRCLKNPYYLPELREHTGKEACIRDYVMGFAESREFFQKVTDLLEFSLPMYVTEGKSQLVVAFGCTGGKHRSVCFAEELGEYLRQTPYRVLVHHRELDQDKNIF